MKEVKAIVQPFMLEKVLTALDSMQDLPGVTLSEIMGWGRFPERRIGHDVEHAGHGFSKKIKLEIVVPDGQVQAVVDAIASAARTGNSGDGKIFVHEVEHAIRIRTGEAGPDTI